MYKIATSILISAGDKNSGGRLFFLQGNPAPPFLQPRRATIKTIAPQGTPRSAKENQSQRFTAEGAEKAEAAKENWLGSLSLREKVRF